MEEGSDPNEGFVRTRDEPGERQFLIKWTGWSHLGVRGDVAGCQRTEETRKLHKTNDGHRALVGGGIVKYKYN